MITLLSNSGTGLEAFVNIVTSGKRFTAQSMTGMNSHESHIKNQEKRYGPQ